MVCVIGLGGEPAPEPAAGTRNAGCCRRRRQASAPTPSQLVVGCLSSGHLVDVAVVLAVVARWLRHRRRR
jgi:hypothetical protein